MVWSMKPILFNTVMVQAILAGQKTMTRRVCKPLTLNYPAHAYLNETPEQWLDRWNHKPPYQPGDILWVRETWRIGAWDENWGAICVDYKADGHARRDWIKIEDEERFAKYWIESADDAATAGLPLDEDEQYHWKPGQGPTHWRPSIHMPREAARIFLRVTEVRAERLQDMYVDDAISEGAWGNGQPHLPFSLLYKEHPNASCNAIASFANLWDSLNAKRGYGWDTNPWVWVISFERCEKPN